MTHARRIAIELLERCQSGEQTLDHLILQADRQIGQLQRADRALVHALVYGVLRWRSRLDWVISHLTARPGKKIDPLVQSILRMGLFQIQYLQRVPDSAAVNTSVELAKEKRRKWATGFINGVLRRAARSDTEIPWPDRELDPVDHISVVHAFPNWLIARWIDRWGLDPTEKLCEKINTIANITLRTNPLCGTRPEVLESAREMAESAVITPHSPQGISISSPRQPIHQWPAFKKGWFQVQGEASQCIGHLVDPQPGETIWDACAGLGTKTAHLAQLMENKGRILATDLYEKKLARMELEMERMGISIVHASQQDLTQPPPHDFSEEFDRILVDAPCSGLGVLQKNPDGKWRNPPQSINTQSQRQSALLDNVAPHLKTNGRLVFAVCSFEPEENKQVVDRFLQKHPEFVIDHPRLDHLDNHESLITADGFLQTFPHRHQMDGFFAAAFRKKG